MMSVLSGKRRSYPVRSVWLTGWHRMPAATRAGLLLGLVAVTGYLTFLAMHVLHPGSEDAAWASFTPAPMAWAAIALVLAARWTLAPSLWSMTAGYAALAGAVMLGAHTLALPVLAAAALAAVLVWVVSRHSRRDPGVVLLAAAALIVLAAVTDPVVPGPAPVALAAATAALLALTCGPAHRLVDRLAAPRDRDILAPDAPVAPSPNASAPTVSLRAARTSLARALAGLPGDYRVLDRPGVDRSLPCVDHLLVGPNGITLIQALPATASPSQAADGQVLVPGADLPAVLAGMLAYRDRLATRLRVDTGQVSLIVAVAHPTEPSSALTVAVRDSTTSPGREPARASLISIADLPDHLAVPIPWWDPATVTSVARRAHARLSPAYRSSAGSAALNGATLVVGTVDVDGQILWPAVRGPLTIGERVTLRTPDGDLRGFVVLREPHPGPWGDTVAVCLAREFDHFNGHVPDGGLEYPVAAVHRDPSP